MYVQVENGERLHRRAKLPQAACGPDAERPEIAASTWKTWCEGSDLRDGRRVGDTGVHGLHGEVPERFGRVDGCNACLLRAPVLLYAVLLYKRTLL